MAIKCELLFYFSHYSVYFYGKFEIHCDKISNIFILVAMLIPVMSGAYICVCVYVYLCIRV